MHAGTSAIRAQRTDGPAHSLDSQGGSTNTGSGAQAPKCSYSLYRADLSGNKTISRNSTTPAPIQTPANATYFLCLDKGGRARNEWVLQLCDIRNYAASHLHTASAVRLTAVLLDCYSWVSLWVVLLELQLVCITMLPARQMMPVRKVVRQLQSV